MNVHRKHSEADLPSALLALRAAVSDLCEPRTMFIDTHRFHSPSVYLQLRDAVPGEQGTGHMPGRSMPPLWIDAVDLLSEIDTAVECWQPAYSGVPPTVGRLRWLANRSWRPQDVRGIHQIVAALDDWTTKIERLLDPEAVIYLPDCCPRCGQKTSYRRDNGGDLVRTPALKLTKNQVECQCCTSVWAPDLLMHLCRLLGYQLPQGVLI